MITQTILLPKNFSPRRSKADCFMILETTLANKNSAASSRKGGKGSMGIDGLGVLRRDEEM